MTKTPSKHKTLEEWFSERVPDIPEPFLPFLLAEKGTPFSPDVLVEKAEESLSRALQGSGIGREAAFHLLAADAFLTYACEVAAEEPSKDNLPGELEALLARFGKHFG